MAQVGQDALAAFEATLPAAPAPAPAAQPGAATPAQAAHDAVGLTPAQVQGPTPLPTDDRALDRIATAVEWQESGGRENAVSPKGAAAGQGPMGISAAVAADYKGDASDPHQNREMGRTHLQALHDKYGNWVDALAAYDWGPGNVDKWIAGGRKGALPNETRNYINSVQERAGLPGALVVVQKRALSSDDLDEMDKRMAGAAPGDIQPQQPPGLELVPGRPPEAYQDYELTGAFLTGMRRGMMELVTGPVQAGLEQVAPEAARSMTSAINDFEGQFDAMTSKHPVAEAVGRVIGTTGAILGTKGMLGAVKVGTTLAEVLPAVVRYGAAGAALGATEFRRGEDEWPRWADAAVGATLGAAGSALGSALGWGSRYLAASNAFQDFTKLLQDSVGDLSKSTSRIKTAFLDNYQRVWQEKNDLYTLRNQAGREFEGFEPQGMGVAVQTALEANRQAGVSTVVRATANKVIDELGLREIAANEAAHDKLMEQHAEDYQRWEQQNFAGLPQGSQREGMMRQQVQSGAVPRPPDPPPPLERQFVTAERYSAAQQAISRAGVAARKPQDKAQLRMLSNGLAEEAKAVAADHGMAPQEFLRRANEANEFFKENIAPIYDSFVGRRTPTQAAEQLTNADFYNRVSKALKANDSERLAKLAQALGPTAKQEMAHVAEREMLQAVGKTRPTNGITAISKYVRDRQDALRELLGRDRLEQLKGEANIAEELMNHSYKRHQHLWAWGTRSALVMFGGERIIEGVLHGRPERIGEGVGLIATPFAVHAVGRILQKLTALPYMLPILRSAARMRPGSPELDQALRRVTMRLGLGGPIAQRNVQGIADDQAAAP